MIQNLPLDQHGGPRSLWAKFHPELFPNEQAQNLAVEEAESVSLDSHEDVPRIEANEDSTNQQTHAVPDLTLGGTLELEPSPFPPQPSPAPLHPFPFLAMENLMLKLREEAEQRRTSEEVHADKEIVNGSTVVTGNHQLDVIPSSQEVVREKRELIQQRPRSLFDKNTNSNPFIVSARKKVQNFESVDKEDEEKIESRLAPSGLQEWASATGNKIRNETEQQNRNVDGETLSCITVTSNPSLDAIASTEDVDHEKKRLSQQSLKD